MGMLRGLNKVNIQLLKITEPVQKNTLHFYTALFPVVFLGELAKDAW